MESALTPPADRQARAAKILSAATTLLIRHGYQRISMEDVARQAGVGTGTLYLHWKSKDALFETVLLRELITIWGELAQQLAADPGNALLHRLLGHLLRAVKQRPLARALFTRDSALLGKLAQRSVVLHAQPLANDVRLISTLRDLGLIRRDVALDVQAYAFSAIWTGFSLVDSLLADDDQVGLNTQIDALSHVIRRTFEPDTLPDPEALRDRVAPSLTAFLNQAQAIFEQHIEARTIAPR